MIGGRILSSSTYSSSLERLQPLKRLRRSCGTCKSRRWVRASYTSQNFVTRKHQRILALAVMAGGSLRGGWGMLLHPTVSLFTAYRFQPLKRLFIRIKRRKVRFIRIKSLFTQEAQETGERAPKPLPAGGLAPATGLS